MAFRDVSAKISHTLHVYESILYISEIYVIVGNDGEWESRLAAVVRCDHPTHAKCKRQYRKNEMETCDAPSEWNSETAHAFGRIQRIIL